MRKLITIIFFVYGIVFFVDAGAEESCASLAQKLLAEPHKKIERGASVISFLPRNEQEYHNVFSAAPTASELNENIRANRNINRKLPAKRMVSPPNDIDELSEQLKSAKTKYVIIIGHNDGEHFYFLNKGVKYSFGELESACGGAEVNCIFLSCAASKHLKKSAGSINFITPYEAFSVAKKLNKQLADEGDKLGNNVDIPLALIKEVVGELERDTKEELEIVSIGLVEGTFIIIVGGGAIGIIDNPGSDKSTENSTHKK